MWYSRLFIYLVVSIQHLDLWFDLMWEFRPSNADWTLTGTLFLKHILDGLMYDHYSNGVEYPVAWRDVEKVSLPHSFAILNPDILYTNFDIYVYIHIFFYIRCIFLWMNLRNTGVLLSFNFVLALFHFMTLWGVSRAGVTVGGEIWSEFCQISLRCI